MKKLEFEEHTLEVTRKAHVYINNPINSSTRYIWIVAHGYGQTGSRIISKFDRLDKNAHTVICPEGLSLFYWGGVHGTHAASWMTSKNRLDEIDDFCNYLDGVYEKYVSPHPQCRVVFMGFSQGATTLYRWVESRKRKFDFFINWAGWFPEDIDMKPLTDHFNHKHLIVYGNNDQYLTDERIQVMNSNLSKAAMTPDFTTFDGKHEINRDVVSQVINTYLNDSNG